MAVGVVRSFDEEAGYGFIETDEGEKIFVHHSSIVMDGFRTLREGQSVEFSVEQGPKGPSAKNVKPL